MVAHDADSAVTLTYSLVAESGVTVAMNQDGTFTAAVSQGAVNPWFTYQAFDGLRYSNLAEYRAAGVRTGRSGVVDVPPVLYTLNLLQGCTASVEYEDTVGTSQSGVILSEPQNGVLTPSLNGMSVAYTPNSGFYGADWFTYTVTSGPDAGEIIPVSVTVAPADFLGIDSHNTQTTYNTELIPQFQPTPDLPDKQNLSLPGKIIPLDTGDSSGDGVPGYAAGYNLDGLPGTAPPSWVSESESTFVPMTVTLPSGFDPVNGQIDLSYSASDPAAVVVSGDGSNDSPYAFRLPGDGGALRIWTSPSNRTDQPFSDPDPGAGFYMPPGTYTLTDMEQLGLAHNSGTTASPDWSWPSSFTLWIERVRPSQDSDERKISLSVDPTGTDNWSAADYVVVGDAPSLVIDSDNVSAGMPSAGVGGDSQSGDLLTAINDTSGTPGKIVVVDDSLVNGVPAYANLAGDNVVPFVPLVVILPEGVSPSTAVLSFDYDGSDPMAVTNVGTTVDPDYQPGPGSLRLWTLDGTQVRSGLGIASGGNYITPDQSFAASLLGPNAWQPVPGGLEQQATIYIEAVRPSLTTGDLTIQYSLDADGNGDFTPPVSVHVHGPCRTRCRTIARAGWPAWPKGPTAATRCPTPTAGRSASRTGS